MKKKVVSVLLCVAMTATMLLGCSAGSEKSDSKKSSKSETKTEVFKKEAAQGPAFPYFPLIPCGKSRTMLLQTQFRAVIIKTSWESMSIAHFSFQKNKR